MRRFVVVILGLSAGIVGLAGLAARPAGAAVAPTITSLSRPSIGQGGAASVIVTGTGFVSGARVTVAGLGLTVGRTSVKSSTSAVVRIAVAPAAPIGSRAFTVTNPDLQAATCATCFSVTPAPVITGITDGDGLPITGVAVGTTKMPVTISGTGFQSGMAVRSNGGLSFRVGVYTPTMAVAWISASRYALPGPRVLTPVNRDMGRSKCSCFSVNPRPTITSVSPTKVARGEITTVTITGTGFQSDPWVELGGGGATLWYTILDSPTQLRAVIGVAPDAVLDTRGITVWNRDGGWVLSSPMVAVSDVAYVYGDSVTHESIGAITAAGDATERWIVRPHAYGGTAPCDWVDWLSDDLFLHQPKRVTLMSMGNWNTGSAACTTRGADPGVVVDSTEYLAAYRSWVEEFIAVAKANGAKVMLVAAPPAAASLRNAAISHINAMLVELATGDPMVSVVGTVRTALSDNGAFVDRLACLPNETATMGCTGGLIPIRTLAPQIDAGLHLCPTGLYGTAVFAVCDVYSSGSQRYAAALVGSIVAAGP